jgi:hypothetical protein
MKQAVVLEHADNTRHNTDNNSAAQIILLLSAAKWLAFAALNYRLHNIAASPLHARTRLEQCY